MKTTVAICASILSTTIGAFAQGTVQFDNHIVCCFANPTNTIVDAPFFDDRGVRLEGPSYVAQLYVWRPGDGFIPVGIPAPFVTNGYFNGYGIELPPPFAPFLSVWVQVRAWQIDSGPTFEQAALAGGWTGSSEVLFVPSTGGGNPPTAPAPLIGLKYPGSPLIVRQPQAQSVRPGERATLSLIASSGVQMSYQWYQDLGDRPDGLIVGATNSTYSTPSVCTNTTFWVSVANSAGSVPSDKVAVTLVPGAPRLTLERVAGLSELTLHGLVGTTYRIEYSTNLSSTNWTHLVELSLRECPFRFVDSGATDSPVRFYRAVAP